MHTRVQESEADEDELEQMVLWDHEEEVVTGPESGPRATPKCIWLVCQDQVQRDTPEAWPCPINSRL